MFEFLAPFMGSMIRHGITTVAGYLVAAGLLQSNQTESFVAACMLFAGIGWSVWHKINTPEMLQRMTERMKAKNVKRAGLGYEVFTNAAAILIGGFVVFSMLASPAGAQGIFTFGAPPAKAHTVRVEHRKGGPKIIHIEPMKAGLSSLIQSVSPIQIGVQGPDQLWANISKVALDDLQTALASASAVDPATNASKSRVACYTSIVALLSQQTSAAAATTGSAVGNGVFTHFERLAQLSDALQPGSQMQVACAPVAQAMRLGFAQFLTTVTAGGLGLAKFGILP